MFDDLFNERDGKWLKIYKRYTQVMFWLFVAAGVLFCFLAWIDCGFWLTGSLFVNGILCLASGLFLAFVHLICSMLIIQFLDNVQYIRNRIESGTLGVSSEQSAGATVQDDELPEL